MNRIYCATTIGEAKNSAEDFISKVLASQEPKQYTTQEEADLDLYIPSAEDLQAPRKAARRKRFLMGIKLQTERILNVDSVGDTSCCWIFHDNDAFEEFEEEAIDFFVNEKGYHLETQILPNGMPCKYKMLSWSFTPSSKT